MCTFTNTKHASLTVVKETVPASDPQDFDFDLTGAGVPADLDLDTDAGNATLPSQDTFNLNAAQLGAHTVSESAVAGWSLTDLDCTGDADFTELGSTATLDIDAGETVVCTFENTKHASLTVVKETVPASDPQDFDFDLTGAGVPADLDLDTDAGNATLPSQDTFNLNAAQLGAHTVSESAVAGWSLTDLDCTGDADFTELGSTATLDIDAGETVVCTFENTKHASLTVVKETDPASDPQDFDFDLTGAGVPADLDLDTDAGNATLPSQDTFNLNAAQLGAHTVSESAVAGWSLTDLDCTGDADFTELGSTATLDIDAGETVVCTFENTKHASLTVVKETDPASDPQDFDFDLTGAGVPADLDLDTDAGNATLPSQDTFNLNAAQLGAHTVSESAVAGWSLTDLDCTGDADFTELGSTATLDIDAGETVVCTFENTKHATVTYQKVTDPASDPQDFEFAVTGTGLVAENLDTDPISLLVPSSHIDTLDPTEFGPKTISETVPTGWDLASIVCTGDADAVVTTVASLDVDAGETIVCTFTNNKRGTIIIQKITKPAGAAVTFNFDAAGGTNPAYTDFNLTGQAGSNSNTQVLKAGTYTATELVPAGWVLTGIGGSSDPNTPLNCAVTGSGGSTGLGNLATQTATIVLKNGDTVTCVFENTGPGTTRTQGFWATHFDLAVAAWFGGTAGGHTFPGVAIAVGDITLCGRLIDSNGELMGAFWSDISKTSTGGKRSALDQARMRLLQQLIAAELNASAFGSSPSAGSFAAWETAFCGTNLNAIKLAATQAAAFNEGGDSGVFTPGTSADPKTRQIHR